MEDADGEVQQVPLGRMLAGALTQPGTVEEVDAPETTGFDWQLTEQSDARDGLADGTYADRKSTRLNSSHVASSYAVFCLKKKISRRHEHGTSRRVAEHW